MWGWVEGAVAVLAAIGTAVVWYLNHRARTRAEQAEKEADDDVQAMREAVADRDTARMRDLLRGLPGPKDGVPPG